MNKTSRSLRSDGESTRARILEAAGELFAAKAYAETSNKAIASLAKVDLASINYHFGNRNDLYQTVLKTAHNHLLSMTDLQALIDSPTALEEKLQALFEILVDWVMQEPQAWQLRVLAREVLAPSSHLQVLFQDEAEPKLALIKQLLSKMTQIPEDDPALTCCLLSVIAPCLMLLVGGRNFPGPMTQIFSLPKQAVVRHFYLFALAGLAGAAKEYQQQA